MSNNVLIADDLKTNRTIIKAALTKKMQDLTLFEAKDGIEALEILREHPINVVILDIVMPRKDGIQVLEEMMSTPGLKEIPVIMFTAVDQISSLEKVLSLGALDYFTKPLTEEQIRITLPLKVKNALKYYNQKQQLMKYHDHMMKEMQLAEKMQRLMLSDYTRYDKYDVWGQYIPCENIGGDIYCTTQVKEKLWFMIADVSGHGISSAMISAMLKVIFNMSVVRCKTPGQVLQMINKMIFESFGPDTEIIISAFVGYIDHDELFYSNAGHPHPLLFRKTALCMEELQMNGFLIGMFERMKYTTKRIPLGLGDAILLYSDGLFENGTVKQFAKMQDVRSFCDRHVHDLLGDIPNLLKKITNFFCANGDFPFMDDMSLVVIKKN